MNSQTVSRRKSRQRGNAVIEVGLIVVLLFGLIFMVVDLSMLLFIRSTIQQAVRDGVRVGVTGRLVQSTSFLNDSVTKAVQDGALGFLNGATGACRISINYYDPNTGAASAGGQGNILVVAVNNYSYTPLGAIMKSANPLALSVSSSDIVERCPLGGCPTVVNPNAPACP
jgi:Flp pilus assembly protein TadG